MIDPHELRMGMANGAMASVAAFDDDDTVALLEPAALALHALGEDLRAHGLTDKIIAQILVGLAIGAATENIGE